MWRSPDEEIWRGNARERKKWSNITKESILYVLIYANVSECMHIYVYNGISLRRSKVYRLDISSSPFSLTLGDPCDLFQPRKPARESGRGTSACSFSVHRCVGYHIIYRPHELSTFSFSPYNRLTSFLLSPLVPPAANFFFRFSLIRNAETCIRKAKSSKRYTHSWK